MINHCDRLASVILIYLLLRLIYLLTFLCKRSFNTEIYLIEQKIYPYNQDEWYIYIYYCWFVLWEWISQSHFTSKVKTEMWDAMKSPFWAKHINDNMFIENDVIIRKHRYYVNFTLDIIVCKYQMENVQIIVTYTV